MSLMWVIYWANTVDTIRIFFGGMAYISGFGTLMWGGLGNFAVLEGECNRTTYIKILRMFVITAIISSIIAIFTPDKDTIYLMAGTDQINQLSQTSEGQKVKTIIDLGLDKALKSLQEEKR